MKKRNLLLLPLFALLLAGCKPAASSSDKTSGPVSSEVPKVSDDDSLPEQPSGVEEVIEEKTIAEIRKMTKDGESATASQKELQYKTKGIVTSKFRGAVLSNAPAWNIAIQDGDDALLLYAIEDAKYQADFKDVKVGDELEVTGYLAAYNGLRELNGIKYVSHKAATAIVPEVLASIKKADLTGKDSKLVKIEGLKLMSKPTLQAEMEGDRSNITINMDIEKAGVKIGTYMHHSIPMEDAQAAVAKLEKVTSNSTLTWTGILGMNAGDFQLTNVGAEEWDITLGDPVTLSSLEFSDKTKAIEFDGKYQTKLVSAPWDGPLEGLVYDSSDKLVATVDNAGLVTAVASGTTNITATVGDKVATVAVTVKEKPEVPEVELVNFDFEDFDDKSWGYTTTEITKNGLKFKVKEARVDFDASDSASATDGNGKKVLRLRGKNVAYVESPVFESVSNVVFEAKYYSSSNKDAVMKVSYKTAEATEWTLAETITLTAEYVEQIVKIDQENVAVRIDATAQSSNIDNLVIKGYGEITPVEPDTPDYPTIEEVRALADNAETETFGVITGIARSSSNPSYQNHMLVTIQYGDHAIQTYNAIDAQVDDLKVGDLVHVKGKKATYKGLIQLNPTSLIEKLDFAAPEIVPFEVVEFSETALTGMSSRLVSVKGLVYVSGEVTAEGNSTNSPIKFKFGDVDVTLQISKHFLESDRAELKALIEGLVAGDTVDFTGPLGWFDGPQLNGMNASMLKVNKA